MSWKADFRIEEYRQTHRDYRRERFQGDPVAREKWNAYLRERRLRLSQRFCVECGKTWPGRSPGPRCPACLVVVREEKERQEKERHRRLWQERERQSRANAERQWRLWQEARFMKHWRAASKRVLAIEAHDWCRKVRASMREYQRRHRAEQEAVTRHQARLAREQSKVAKPHCKQGHLLDERNTYYLSDGYRGCRTCRRAAVAARRVSNVEYYRRKHREYLHRRRQDSEKNGADNATRRTWFVKQGFVEIDKEVYRISDPHLPIEFREALEAFRELRNLCRLKRVQLSTQEGE